MFAVPMQDSSLTVPKFAIINSPRFQSNEYMLSSAMHLAPFLFHFAGLFAASCHAAAIPLEPRQEPVTSHPYAPIQTQCPSSPIIREASRLSDGETSFLQDRHRVTQPNLVEFLKSADLASFDAQQFVETATKNITIALAFSGGGVRAMLSGAGQILALDGRFSRANEAGLGGLLESSTYVAGSSGGSWLVGTLALNNWISVEDVIKTDSTLWDLDESFYNPFGWKLSNVVAHYRDIKNALGAKMAFGFRISITDIWGRIIAFRLFGQTRKLDRQGFRWSGTTAVPKFQTREMPFPIIVANARDPGALDISLGSTVFEMNPFEIGSWDSTINSFADNKFFGTRLDDGKPTGPCYTNFDDAGFYMATSSSVFSFAMESLVRTVSKIIPPKTIKDWFGGLNADVAIFSPNAFYHSSFAINKKHVSSDELHLSDGGSDGQNIPYYPFLQPEREVDVVISFDSSSDTKDNWPNGISLVNTYKRQLMVQENSNVFPPVPSTEEMLRNNRNQRPVFLGCNLSQKNQSNEASFLADTATKSPLVVYIPNTKYSFGSNFGTSKMSYSNEEKFGVIRNGFETATRGNLTVDPDWRKCVACATIKREQERRGHSPSAECLSCFTRYCWEPKK